MKIIGTDNYARESVPDFLVCENVFDESAGQIMVDALNEANGEDGPFFFKMVANNQALWPGLVAA